MQKIEAVGFRDMSADEMQTLNGGGVIGTIIVVALAFWAGFRAGWAIVRVVNGLITLIRKS